MPRVTTLAEHLQRSFDADAAAGKVVPVFKKALLYGTRPAIKDDTGTYSYVQLYMAAKTLSFQVSNVCGESGLFFSLFSRVLKL